MHIETLLNRYHPIQGWTYTRVHLVSARKGDCIEVEIKPFKRNKPICSGCGRPGPGYDHGDNTARRFRFIPVFAVSVMLLYTMRRVDCKGCNKVLIEKVPW